ncbi:hypothetical protein GCM10023340_07790 [Nocardioides marinquilinus]|uniref:Uncharacterized protein n=1 Tax=Nocardioides marinquilinus TaxID=1210400 RepID=A0ABP9PD22_9ACTN
MRAAPRDLAAAGLWAAAAIGWVLAMRVPWYRAGVLGDVTVLDGAELLRAGVFGVPAVAGFAVVALPAVALVLLGLAPVHGRAAMVARVVLWLVGTGSAVALLLVTWPLGGGAIGLGAGLVVLACVLGAIALGCATVTPHREAADGVRGMTEPLGG